MSVKPTSLKDCLTPEFRASYPHLFTAKAFKEGDEPKFSVTMLFDKSTDISVLKRAAVAAAVDEWGPKEKGKWPDGFAWPFKDGDKKADQDGYKGTIYCKAASKFRPGVVDRKRMALAEDAGVIYAGCYLRATLSAKAYKMGAQAGVTFYLQNVQFLRDGDAFSGRKKAADEFDEVADAGDDAANYGGGASDGADVDMFG